jgi:drug/metabolite transporter (DMT)-like permease
MQLERRHSARGSLTVVIAASLFGILGSLSRLAEQNAGLTTIGFVSWRAAFGALVVAAFIGVRVARGRPVVGWGVLSFRGRTSLFVVTLAGVALNLAIFSAFQRVTIGLALLVFYTYPALVTLVVVAIERRRPDRVQLAALAMATLGMAILVVGGIDPATGLTFDLGGLLLAFVAAAMQVVFILVSRRGYSALPADEASFVILAGGCVAFLAVALAIGQAGAIAQPFEDPSGWSYLLIAGVFGAGIPTTLFLLGIRWIGGVRAGILALIEPVVGTLLAAIFLAETLRPVQLVGGLLVLVAAILLQRERASPADGTDEGEAIAGEPGDPAPNGVATFG